MSDRFAANNEGLNGARRSVSRKGSRERDNKKMPRL